MNLSLKYMKTTAYFCSVVFLLAVDRFLKFLAINGYSWDISGDFFKFSLVKNPYIAFSLPLSGNLLMILISSVILFLIAYFIYLIKKAAYAEAGFLLLIISGACSNLFDRIKSGFVIDYFDLSYFTVFNLADVMIFSGVIGIIFFNKSENSI